MKNEIVYEYTFSPWPVSQHPKNNQAVFRLFKNLNMFITEHMTQLEFNNFREDLFKAGIDLHEITRRPHILEETVI